MSEDQSDYEYSDEDVSLSEYIVQRPEDGNEDAEEDAEEDMYVSEESMDESELADDEEHVQELVAVKEDAAGAWTALPETLRNQKRFILAALQSPTLPSKDDFERKLPTELRCDREINLAFVRRDDFGRLAEERGSKVPDRFRNDKEMILALCEKFDNALMHASEDLCDDDDVVRAALTRNGRQIVQASTRIQRENVDLCRLACEQDIGYFRFIHEGPARAALGADRTFMTEAISTLSGQILPLYGSTELQQDRDLALLALEDLELSVHTVHVRLKNDIDFMRSAIKIRVDVYGCELGMDVAEDEGLAMQALAGCEDRKIWLQAFRRVVSLPNHREAASILRRKALYSHLTSAHTYDHQTMAATVESDPMALLFAGESLQNDREFLRTCIMADSVTYFMCRSEMKRDLYLAAAAIRAGYTDPCITYTVATECPAALSTNKDVLLDALKTDNFHGRVFRDTMNFHGGVRDARIQWKNVRRVLLPALRSFYGDFDVMLAATRRDSYLANHVLNHADERIRFDHRFWFSFPLGVLPGIFQRHCPQSVKRNHPEITVKLCAHNCLKASDVEPGFWEECEMARHWLSTDGNDRNNLDAFSLYLRQQPEVGLLMAEYDVAALRVMDETVLGDVDFMKHAVDFDGRALTFGTRKVRFNLMLAVRALANHRYALSYATKTDLLALQREVRARLDLHRGFVEMLCAVARDDSDSQRTFEQLNGKKGLVRHIADFVGVPTGEKLRLLRRAASTFSEMSSDVGSSP